MNCWIGTRIRRVSAMRPAGLPGFARVSVKSDGTEYGCVLSEDDDAALYRYALWRIWDPDKPKWLFVLLNPATADHEEDDDTIKRVIKRARNAGMGGVVVANAGAIRNKDPYAARAHDDPIGPHNEIWLRAMISACDFHIVGYGMHARHFGGDALVKRVFAEKDVTPHAIRLCQDGTPEHPLYLAYALEPQPLDW